MYYRDDYKVDKQGRIVIPKYFRNALGIDESTPINIYLEAGKIIIEKAYIPNTDGKVINIY